eukprot:7024983-Pyramimonas_sp.AAC.1
MGRSTEGPSGMVRMPPPTPLWHTAHTFRGFIVSSTEGLGGIVHMAPWGALPKAPAAWFTCPASTLAYRSH